MTDTSTDWRLVKGGEDAAAYYARLRRLILHALAEHEARREFRARADAEGGD